MSPSGETACVIVVNWNNATDTLRCLDSLGRVNADGMNVLLVDNGSSDGSVGRIRERFPDVEILELGSNTGYGGGCNAGYERARSTGADYVVFLNNDTVVDPGFLGPLLTPLRERSEIGMTAPCIYYMDRPDRIWYAGGFVDLRTGRFAHRGIRRRDAKRFGVAKETGYATGCCLAMRVADFGHVGGFDRRFGMYGEDVDLSLNVRRSGKQILYTPSSKVWHCVSSSGGGQFHPHRLWRKHVSLLKLLVKHRAWIAIILSFLLAPSRLLQGAASVVLFGLGAKTERLTEEGG